MWHRDNEGKTHGTGGLFLSFELRWYLEHHEALSSMNIIKHSQTNQSPRVITVVSAKERKQSRVNTRRSKIENERTIIVVIEVQVRVFGIVDHKWTSQPVAVLVREVRVIPKGSRLEKNRQLR